MKSLQIIIFICVALQITFLLSMETQQESLSSSFSENVKSPKNPAKKKKSTNKLSKNSSKLDKKILEKLPNDLKFIPIISDLNVFDQRQSYVGTLPEGTDFFIQSLLNMSIIKNKLNPVLAKIVGPPDSGKTTLVNTIVQRTSNNNCHSKFNLDELLLDTAQKNSYISDPEKYIESLIQNFFQSQNTTNCPCIIAFTKELPLTNNDFKKLRSFLWEIQKPFKTAPLLVLHEGQKAQKYDCNYHDKIIYIKKPSPENIIALLSNKFAQHSFEHEDITSETVEILKGSFPPYIQRIAEDVLRKAITEKTDYITNEIIQKTIQQQPLAWQQK